MRILTVRQPWAWAIIHGGKDVENRVRNIAGDYRGPVAIHAALTDDRTAIESWPSGAAWPGPVTRGAILGVVDLTGVHVCQSHREDSDVPDCVNSGTPLAMTCSPWADFRRGESVHHLKFANPRPLSEPIPFKGALGLRKLDADTTARILAATSEEKS